MSDQDDFDRPTITRGRPPSKLQATDNPEPEPVYQMKLRPKDFFIGLFWMALSAAIFWMYGAITARQADTAAATSSRQAQRLQATQAAIRAGPQTSTWETPHGTVITLDIPKATLSGMFVETKHCIVWRDASTKTSAIHCDKEEIDIKNYPTDRPDFER
jgi:hypothetical protein